MIDILLPKLVLNQSFNSDVIGMIFLTFTFVISLGNSKVFILTKGLGVRKSLKISLFSTWKFSMVFNLRLFGTVV